MATAPTIRILEGAAALGEIASAGFLERWRVLQRGCPWATAFQDPAFVLTWYQAYADQFTPLVVVGTREENLVGLLTLALGARGRIVVAGSRQAEYQAWLATPDEADSFPIAAIGSLSAKTREPLTFQFLPSNTPVGWVEGADDRGLAVRLEGVPRSRMSVGPDSGASDSLKKKSNKSRINRLAKLGKLEFRRLTTVEELRVLLPQIITLYDLRQISLGSDPPFASDPHKTPFHLALIAEPNLLHVTVMTIDGAVIAAHLGVNDGRTLHLGILTHSPAYGVHSPGKLIILYLAQLLQSEGFQYFDLTPGGDSWKDRFATDHDSVWRLVVFPTRGARARHDTAAWAASQARTVLRAGGVAPAAARTAVSRALGQPLGALKSAVGWGASKVYRQSRTDLYARVVGDLAEPAGAGPAKNCLDDLMLYRQTPGAPERRAFLQDAVGRLEEGHDVYTIIDQGRLVHWGWLAELEEKIAIRDGQELLVEPGTTLLYDFFTLPKYRRRGLSRRTIDEMSRHAARHKAVQLVALVSADQQAWRRVVEDSRFRRKASLGTRVFAGVTKRWQRS